jgi:hypothetical protein
MILRSRLHFDLDLFKHVKKSYTNEGSRIPEYHTCRVGVTRPVTEVGLQDLLDIKARIMGLHSEPEI